MNRPGDGRPAVASSHAYRRISAAERLAAALGRLLGAGNPLRRLLRAAYRGALALRTRGRGLECTLPGGERIRVLPAYRFATWHPDEYAAFRDALRPGDTALDVGANVGSYALLFGQWVGPGGRVHAFEPSPAAFEGLSAHIALNGLADRVTARAEAVGERTGELTLRDEGFHGTTREWQPGDAGASRLVVPVVTIDEACRDGGLRPRLIKVDVEGAELAVLRGARETIRTAGPDLALFVELHPTIWEQAGLRREDFLAELDAQGLRIETLRPGSDPWSVEGVCVRLVRA
jgi:FkbM family methyltransferase